METFSTIVLIADGLLTLFGLAALLIKPVRDRITKAKDREQKIQDNFNSINKKLDDVQSRQVVSEKDELRTQLLLLIADYPHETAEILKIAEHYFDGLHGNWYLTSLFNKWLTDNNIAKPEWFKV